MTKLFNNSTCSISLVDKLSFTTIRRLRPSSFFSSTLLAYDSLDDN